MGARFLIDTNIVIYFLNGRLSLEGKEWLLHATAQESLISVITEIELLGWKHVIESSEKAAIEGFIHDSTVFGLSRDVVRETIHFRQQHAIKLPDAIIAATAKVYSLTLASNNDKDFAGLPGLMYINPMRML